MKILVINCGSSSLKFQLLNMDDESLLASGLAERIGDPGSRMILKYPDGEKFEVNQDMKDHAEALNIILAALQREEKPVISDLKEIDAVGHRVVHGAEEYSSSVLIDENVIETLIECIELAPLHNPANILGIKAIQELLPGVPNVAVFDTAFHQTMPKEAYLYALPYDMYEKHRIRRYGFHGTSHRYVAYRAMEFLGVDPEHFKVITCHLGNGASITAIQDGKSVDTSMGLTPLEGLAMGTRCGDMDPAIMCFIMDKENIDIRQVDELMNKRSGVLGISGVSNDFRDLESAADQGHERAQLALNIFRRRVKKYIGSYAAVMGGLDAIVFTGGLGENSPLDRALILEGLEFLGVEIDPERNNVRGKDALISSDQSKVKVLLIPTNEELAIARDTLEIASKL